MSCFIHFADLLLYYVLVPEYQDPELSSPAAELLGILTHAKSRGAGKCYKSALKPDVSGWSRMGAAQCRHRIWICVRILFLFLNGLITRLQLMRHFMLLDGLVIKWIVNKILVRFS